MTTPNDAELPKTHDDWCDYLTECAWDASEDGEPVYVIDKIVVSQLIATFLSSQRAEVDRLNKVISDCASAAGAAVSPQCSIEFKEMLPQEIKAVIERLQSRIEELKRQVEGLEHWTREPPEPSQHPSPRHSQKIEAAMSLDHNQVGHCRPCGGGCIFGPDSLSPSTANQTTEPMVQREGQLAVWYGAMPESNGKSNFTAILWRKGDGIERGYTIDRSEYPDRVRYEADRVRYLIGEIAEYPCITDYDANKHSGYKGQAAKQWVPLVTCAAGRDGDCNHPDCPQNRDGEPMKSGRHCPLDFCAVCKKKGCEGDENCEGEQAAPERAKCNCVLCGGFRKMCHEDHGNE